VRDCINKQLTHMTTARLSLKDFPIRAMAEAIIAGMRNFVEHQAILGDPDLPRLHGWLYATWSTRQPPIEAGS
jgi:hypothetical protein